MAKDMKPPTIPSSLKLTWKDVQAEAHGSIGILAVVAIVLFGVIVFAVM